MRVYADILGPLINLIKENTDYDAGASTPDRFGSGIFVRVSRAGGGDESFTDQPIIDLEVFGERLLETSDAARHLRGLITSMQGTQYGGVLFDVANSVAGPTYVHDVGRHCFLLTFDIHFRSTDNTHN